MLKMTGNEKCGHLSTLEVGNTEFVAYGLVRDISFENSDGGFNIIIASETPIQDL